MLGERRQSGYALLLFVVVLVGFATLAVSGLLDDTLKNSKLEEARKRQEILALAKEALLSYAVNYKLDNDLEKIGKLPCPDTNGSNGEGNQVANCGADFVNTDGLFPFKSIDLGTVKDTAKECLWYVVSGTYKNNFPHKLRNWDALGYLNVRDENDIRLHGLQVEDFPIALIISPGASINQDREIGNPGDYPKCGATYTLTDYLEGGPNIDYATDLPEIENYLWTLLNASPASQLDAPAFNDRLISITRKEFWDRVVALGDLDFDNSAGVAASTPIEQLTQSLAECLAAYGNDITNTYGSLPYAARVNLDGTNTDIYEYADESNYDDDEDRFYGRFPQVLDNSEFNTNNFVYGAGGGSYCETVVSTPYDEEFWGNWKDQFFYLVSEDFDKNATTAKGSKCLASNCITVNGNPVAAVVLFSGRAQAGQSRSWFWDGASSVVVADNKAIASNYLEGDFADHVYTGGVQDYSLTTTDYAWCVKPDLTIDKCANLP